jgi:ATP-dependent RNA helicase DDX24/MAK5
MEESDEDSKEEEPKPKKQIFDSPKALIISPTRELAMQIKDMIEAVIPADYQEQIKTCCLVGGMSIQKQQRLLSYKPAIIISTPGRLWELMDDRLEPYLMNGLPMIDILVLDEADRMIADGHFKELSKILGHIYRKRVEFKKEALKGGKGQGKVGAEIVREKILNAKPNQMEGFKVVEKKLKDYDPSKVVDLNDAEAEEMLNQNILLENEQQDKHNKPKKNSKKSKQQLAAEKEEEEAFNKDYLKMGGIQHIVCSATMTIDNKGRITPRQQKIMKKKNIEESETKTTLEALCETLRFRSKNPKVIDLTIEADAGKMPASLTEQVARCRGDEKDLYLYYYLQQKRGESVIIFCNAITATRRLSSLLDFLKIKNSCLHSKMQQRQRLKNLEKFKRGVNEIEAGVDGASAILVCTDVAARGLDIPYVSNVLHYQCPWNAEIYVHRCGRTARIGRSGECLALLSPEDNKGFKSICQVLKKTEQ